MSLSASFSDFPDAQGTSSGFTPATGIAQSRKLAGSMALIPVIAPMAAGNKVESPGEEIAAPPQDRRDTSSASRSGRAGMERRQFGSSHVGLSSEGRELASAIDAYKLQHHRRYITCDEMLVVLNSLGYAQHTVAADR